MENKLTPRKYSLYELHDFVFPTDDSDLRVSYEPNMKPPASSPCKALVQNILPSVMTALSTVVSQERMLATSVAKTVLLGAATTAASSLSTASVGGVPGMAVGALIAGGIIAYNSFKSKNPQEIMKSFSQQDEKQLFSQLRNGLQKIGIKDMATDIMNREDVKQLALEILSNFLTEKFGLKLTKL